MPFICNQRMVLLIVCIQLLNVGSFMKADHDGSRNSLLQRHQYVIREVTVTFHKFLSIREKVFTLLLSLRKLFILEVYTMHMSSFMVFAFKLLLLPFYIFLRTIIARSRNSNFAFNRLNYRHIKLFMINCWRIVLIEFKP